VRGGGLVITAENEWLDETLQIIPPFPFSFTEMHLCVRY